MEERPMIFNAKMVNAILSGRKTQTRRPLKKQYANVIGDVLHRDVWYGCELNVYSPENEIYCPFGKVGDILWVKETFWEDRGNILYDCDQTMKWANGEIEPHKDKWSDQVLRVEGWKKRPSIHMAKLQSRIRLEITDIRVQRVQDITEEEAKAEGVKPDRFLGEGQIGMTSYREGFAGIWTDIYGTWDSNVWCWVIGFRRLP